MTKDKFHEPVLVHEVLEALKAPLKNQARVIDATVGSAGHSLAIVGSGGKILGIDEDKEMLEVAEQRLGKTGGSFKLVHGNFRNIDEIAKKEGFVGADAILFDLGVASVQLTSEERGFSFSNPEANLDMRIDKTFQNLTGADLLNGLRKEHLTVLFQKVLNPFAARKIARQVLRQREAKKITTVGDFLEICQVVKGKPGLHPATLPFLALRMAVNCELENLEEALPKAFSLLAKGGKLLVITFHSGEEKVVVAFNRKAERDGLAKVLSKEPIVPKEDEVKTNPRARSAKLHILEKT